MDACFDGSGSVIHRGRDAWNGILDSAPAGACTARFPLFTTPRIESGGSIAGDVFKCALKPVEKAIAEGTYGVATFSEAQTRRLKRIFPGGVCDYSKPDAGRPGRLRRTPLPPRGR